jgi:hypothetical protein
MRKNFQILRFLRSAGNFGWGSVALAVVLFGISIEEHFRDKNAPAYWLVLVAAVSFTLGAFRAWANDHEAYENEVAKNARPRLMIELAASFFDLSRLPNTNDIQVHVLAYLRVTNLNSPETLIKDGTLVMTVGDIRYKGNGDDISVKGNAIEHVSGFRLGGEVLTEVFGNTLSPFPRLLSVVTVESPLRRGITREGFIVFTFTNQMDWEGNKDIMSAADVVITLRDSFEGFHTYEKMLLEIPHGAITNSGRYSVKSVM